MKKRIVVMVLLIGIVFSPTQKAHAIWWWVAKAAIKKAIVAADLAIQRQQNKIIWLQNAQKTLENAMSKLKLNEIRDWSERQRKLYSNYFEELNKVKSIITYYQRVKGIAQKQVRLVQEYKSAWSLLKNNKNFNPDEIQHMQQVYTGIIEQSLQNIDQLALVINSFRTQMSDAKRLEIINNTIDQTDQNYFDLRIYNKQNLLLSIKRSRDLKEINTVRRMYGIE